jgi:calcineurin-like phosphoesterase family protein
VGVRFLAAAIAVAITLPGMNAPALAAPGDFRSQWVSQSPYPTLGTGTTTSYTVRFRNTGTAMWRRGVSGAQVNLGVAGDSPAFFEQAMAVSWLSPNRIATTAEDTVDPGGIGTFTFTVRAPSAPGLYRVPLRLVVDGVTWLDDQGVHFILMSESGFGARWETQTAYPILHEGESASVSVNFRNTGSHAFVRGMAGQQLNLGVAFDDTSWGPYGVGWLSANRVATTNEPTVPPGAIASFTFAVRAPPAGGQHVLRLRPVVEGVAWLEDQGVHVVITVLGPAVLVGAGDIATCEGGGDEATSALLDAIPGTVVTLGDNAYESGTPQEFAACYDPSWGRQRARTKPAAGNHDYATPGGSGHFGYFGSAAGEIGKGYYSYDLGSWHIIALNSNCGAIGGCSPGSPQEQWLRADLAASKARCTIAYWHHPRFSSGLHGNITDTDAFWRDLYAAGAEVILVGHDHNYERFAPQDPNGVADPARGIREFVVGTGGAPLRPVLRRAANSELVRDDAYGVLKLSLYEDRFDWEFIPVAGKTFSDRGSSSCH